MTTDTKPQSLISLLTGSWGHLDLIPLAENAVKKFKHTHIGTEHILYAMASEPKYSIPLLQKLSITPEEIKSDIEKHVRTGASDIQGENIPVTPRTLKAVELGKKHAASYCTKFRVDHLLSGMLYEGESLGAQVLMDHGDNTVSIDNQLRLLHDPRLPPGINYATIAQRTLDLVGVLGKNDYSTALSDTPWIPGNGLAGQEPAFARHIDVFAFYWAQPHARKLVGYIRGFPDDTFDDEMTIVASDVDAAKRKFLKLGIPCRVE